MILYSVIWLILLVASFVKPKNNLLYYSFIIFLVLLAGFRDVTIGTDTPTYFDIFEWITDESGKYIEPGWYYLNRIVFLCGGNFTTLLLVTSSLTIVPLVYLSNHYKNYRYEILFFYYSMYFYLNSYNGMRQYLAVSIGLFIFEQIRLKKEKWKVICSIIIATMFHYSALLLLLSLIVNKIKIKNSICLCLLFISFVIGSFANISFFEFFAGKYASYLFRDEYGFRESSFSIYFLTLLMNCIFIWIVLFKNKRFEEFWLVLFFLGIVLLNFTFRIGLGARLILYYTITQILVFPMFIHHNIIKNKLFVHLIILIYFSLLFYRNFWSGSTGGDIIPYKSILF